MDGFISLDWRTALLGMCAVQMTAISIALLARRPSKPADTALAATLLSLTGVLVPYIIGYAGLYDRWRWLTFLPVAVPLAVGPLLWGYVHARLRATLPTRFKTHLIPAAAQASYSAVAFALPTSTKWAWYTGAHGNLVAPALDVAGLASFMAYGAAIVRLLGSADHAQDGFAANERRWLTRIVAVLAVAAVVTGIYDVWGLTFGSIAPAAQTWQYLLLAAAALFVSVEGWRRAGELLPIDRKPRGRSHRSRPEPPSPSALGEMYASRIRDGDWWREADLDVRTLARRLGVSESGLSRAFNQGLGVGVARYMNDLRAEAVAEALKAGSDQDLLGLAFENGFSSKASFNRAFQARFGCPPSAFRINVSQSGNLLGTAETRRAHG